MGALHTLGSQSAHRIDDLRNVDGSLGSPDLHHPFRMLQCKTSEAPRHQEQGSWIPREQQQQELGLFSACKLVTQNRNLPTFTA